MSKRHVLSSKRYVLSSVVVVAAVVAAAVAGSFLPRAAAAAQAAAVREDLWVANGPVFAMERVGDTLYVGGQFDHVGPATGSFGVTASETGALDANWPRVNGVVKAVAPDGAGGWFVGGKFDAVGGATVYNIAHLKADKTLDANWNANVSHAQLEDVKDIEVANGTVYVCGAFTQIGGQPRKGLAALDAATGAATAWNPNPSGSVFEIEIIGDRVYVGGSITAVGLSARSGLAAFDLSTGALADWAPALAWPGTNIYGGVQSIEAANGVVYAGGLFTAAGSQARNGLAAFDAATGAALPWNPGPQSSGAIVYALDLDGANLYVGGSFVGIGGQPFRNLAAVSTATGAALDWNPNPGINDAEFSGVGGPYVTDVIAAGGAVYASGNFKRIGGEARRGVAAVDKVTGAALAFRADAGDVAHAIALADGKLAAGGEFRSIGGARRRNLAALDLGTGRATGWSPDAEITTGYASVKTLAAGTGTLYVAGDFDRVGGRVRKNLAEVSLATGAATDWAYSQSEFLHNVSDMEVTTSRLYLAGGFAVYNGNVQIKNLISLSRATATLLTDFAPQPDYGVSDIEISDNTLYAGGAFRQIAGQRRDLLAAFDLSTHALRDWRVRLDEDVSGGGGGSAGANMNVEANASPRVDEAASESAGSSSSAVSSLAVANGRVYFVGRFFEITETPSPGAAAVKYARGHIAAVDAATARLDLNWHPRPNFAVEKIRVYGATAYVAGPFWQLNDLDQFGVAALHALTGEPADWKLLFRHEYGDSSRLVVDFVEHGDYVHVGGLFRNLLGTGRSHLAGVSRPALPNVAPAVGLSVNVNGAVSNAPASVSAGTGTAVTFAAAPRDIDGTVVKVDFYAGATLLASDAAAPYELTRSDLPAGEHLVKAVATDDRGGTGDSAAIRLTVLGDSQGLSIGGRVVDQEGAALAGVTVALGGGRSATALTDSQGHYSFANLAPGGSYSVALALDGYYFHPEGLQFPSLGGSETADFIAYRQVTAGHFTSNLWVPNGAVRAAVVRGDRLYIGGDFTSLRGTGQHGATVSTVTGAVDQRFGRLNGKIYAAVADGAGGWFVGGTFTAGLAETGAGQSQIARMNLAHLRSDGSVDPDWNPGADGKVSALALVGQTLYVGGSFKQIGGQPRAGLAAVDKTTGAVSGWDAKLALKANRAYQPVAVNALLVDGARLFAGGLYDTANGVERPGIAQFDLSAATPALTEWAPTGLQFIWPVRSLALANATRTLYLGAVVQNPVTGGGEWVSAVDADTGVLRTSFNAPKPGGDITSMAVYQNTLFVAGEFTGFHRDDESVVWRRGGLASLDATTGAITGWHPQLGPSGQGGAAPVVHVSGSTVYAGGTFTEAGGPESSPATQTVARRGLAAYDAASGALLPWNPVTGGAVSAFAQNGTTLFVGSAPTTEGVERRHLAALDVNTGQPTEWNPGANGRVVDLALGDGTVFAAGEFTTVGGAAHKNVAEISLSTGAPTEWHPDSYLDAMVEQHVEGSGFFTTYRYIYKVTDLAVASDRVFLGGAFSSLSTAGTQPALVAVSRATGQPLGWDAGFAAGSDVRELVVDGETLYAGGRFTSVGGQQRTHLAALSTSTAQPLAWGPAVAGGADAHVAALALAGDGLYVGGAFNQIGGQPRNHLAELSLQTALPTGWNPDVRASAGADGATVKSLAVAGSLVYAGGRFDAVGEAVRRNLAAVGRATAQATAWNPEVSGGDVLAVTTSTFGGKTFAGGEFTSALGLGANRAYLIGVLNSDPLSLNAAPEVILRSRAGIMESGRAAECLRGGVDCDGAEAVGSQSSAAEVGELYFVDLAAEAFDGDGQIARVEFYQGEMLLGADGARPFTWRRENLPAGTYTFTARALDNMGVPAVSKPLVVTVEAQQTHAIGGRVTLDGAPLAGVSVALSGARTAAAQTDADGRYAFTGLRRGGSYVVRPSLAGYGFTPAEQSVASLTADAALDFAAKAGGGQTAPRSIIISEFRLRGPAAAGADGSLDEFVELYNTTDAPVTVQAGDGSAGWSLAALAPAGSAPAILLTIPNGTVIPARAHYLVANSGGYSLAALAAPDLTYAADIADGSGLALFATANPAAFSPAARLDAVGFAAAAGAAAAAELFREGAGAGSVAGVGAQHSYVRRPSSGAPQDTDDNAADFVLVSADGGTHGGTASVLGAPGPENSQSPVPRGGLLKTALLDPRRPASAAPNRVRDFAATSNGSLGTVAIRRRITNHTGAAVTHLRFRVIELTTLGAPGAAATQADLRLLGAPGVTLTSSTGKLIPVAGATLEAADSQPRGGGLNSTVAVGTITAAAPLADGSSVDVQFLLGVERAGTFRFLVQLEALPGPAGSVAPSRKSADKGGVITPGR